MKRLALMAAIMACLSTSWVGAEETVHLDTLSNTSNYARLDSPMSVADKAAKAAAALGDQPQELDSQAQEADTNAPDADSGNRELGAPTSEEKGQAVLTPVPVAGDDQDEEDQPQNTELYTKMGNVAAHGPVLGDDVSDTALSDMMRPSPEMIIPVATEVKDYQAGFRLMIPWRLLDAVRVNTKVPSESGTIEGYSFNLEGNQDAVYGISLTKRDNVPEQGISQKKWNTTWYNHPVKGMTNEEYLAIWKENSDIFSRNDVSGGLLVVPGADSARWSRMVPKGGNQALFEAEYIMKADPTHRYTLTMTYPVADSAAMEKQIWNTVLPSFQLLTPGPVKRGDLGVDTGVSFVAPKGFVQDKKVLDHLAFTKGDIHLDVSTLPANNGGLFSGYPTLPGKQTLANAYITAIRKIPNSDVTYCEAYITNYQVGYLVSGYSGNEEFVTLLSLTDDNRLAVAKMTAPRGTNLLSDDLKAALKGLRLEPYRDTMVSTYVL